MDVDESYENWIEKNLVIAIPTLGRPKSILKHTLSLFTDRFKDKIIIYLQDNEKPNNINEYEKLHNDYGYNLQMLPAGDIYGIGIKRNQIKYQHSQKFLLMIDDDIRAIVDKSNIKMSPENIENMIIENFRKCREHSLKLWGINPYGNSFYFKDQPTTSLKFICGGFSAFCPGTPLLSMYNCLEDYYNTLTHFRRDGGVYRDNRYGLRTTLFTNKGGLQLLGDERIKEEEANSTMIVNEFSEKMVRKHKKKRGIDLRLNHHYKNPAPLHFQNEDCL